MGVETPQIRLIDFNRSKRLLRTYGGNAGRKICIEGPDGSPWMLKFPEPTTGMKGNIASYTTSPVSEWLGSHIYQSLGIPSHETLLGFREGKVVCACKDFTWPDLILHEFHDVKNSLSDDAEGFEGRPSDGRSLTLSDVLTAIRQLPEEYDVKAALVRFWDMFVTDAFIGNADRNNENWGFLSKGTSLIGLAPVYDNGNAFFNKRRNSTISERIAIDEAIRQDAVGAVLSCYLTDSGRRVSPVSYIKTAADEACNDAVLRFVANLDLERVMSLIDSIPSDFLNFEVMPQATKEFHKRVLTRRYKEIMVPTAERIAHQRDGNLSLEEQAHEASRGAVASQATETFDHHTGPVR